MPNRYTIFLIFLSAYFLSDFFRSANAVIAGDLTKTFNLSPDQLGLMTGLFFGVFALAQLIIGPALDHYGTRRTIGGFILFAALGAVIFALANTFAILCLGRALIGLGMAGVLMGTLKIFANWFPASMMSTISGIFVALGGIGSLVATTPLERLSRTIGWQKVFLIGGALCIISSLLIFLFSRDYPRGQQHIQNKTQGAFLTVFQNVGFWKIAFLNFMLLGSFFTYQSLWMGPYLTDAQQLSSIKASNLLFLMNAASIIGYFVSGYLADKFGLLKTIVISSSLFFLSQIFIAYSPQQTPFIYLALLLMVFGFGGSFNVMLFSHVRQLFPNYLSGRALSLTNMFGIGAVYIMQWLLGLVINTFPKIQRVYSATAFRWVFLITASFGIISLLVYLPFLFKSSGQIKESSST